MTSSKLLSLVMYRIQKPNPDGSWFLNNIRIRFRSDFDLKKKSYLVLIESQFKNKTRIRPTLFLKWTRLDQNLTFKLRSGRNKIVVLYNLLSHVSSIFTIEIGKHLNLALDLIGDWRSTLGSCIRYRTWQHCIVFTIFTYVGVT